MSFNNGVFERGYNWQDDDANGIGIEADRMDGEFDNYAGGLSTCILKDGTQTITADIPFNNNKITGLKDATASSDAANLKVIQNRVGVHGTSSGTDTITLALSPAITAYVAGQEFTFKAGGTNTGAATININAVGAKDIKLPDGTALTAGILTTDNFYKIRYDGTNFVLLINELDIANLTEKTTLVDDDKGVIEDSEATNAKKSFDFLAVWDYIKSKINAECAFVARVSIAMTDVTGDGTTLTVIFNSKDSDIGSNYNNTTGIFTAPVDGLYDLKASLRFDAVASGNTQFFMRFTTTQGNIHLSDILTDFSAPRKFMSALVKLDAGDTVKIETSVQGGTKIVDIAAVNESRFSGHLVRRL